MIQLIPLKDIPIIETEEQLWDILKSKLTNIEDNDILICAHTPWSRVMGYIYELNTINPSKQAIELSEQLKKDPHHVEIILRESKRIIKIERDIIISENHAGVICANGGIDRSNAGDGKVVAVPHNPDKLAQKIRAFVKDHFNKDIAVLISDTVGRALRRGAVNIAIGSAGITPLLSDIGTKDLFGYTMKVSEVAIVDELAGAAELLQGQTDAGIPFVIIRGYSYDHSSGETNKLTRPDNERIFK